MIYEMCVNKQDNHPAIPPRIWHPSFSKEGKIRLTTFLLSPPLLKEEYPDHGSGRGGWFLIPEQLLLQHRELILEILS